VCIGLCITCGSFCARRALVVNCNKNYSAKHPDPLRKSLQTLAQNFGSHCNGGFPSGSELENYF
jgi:hypothetical protein